MKGLVQAYESFASRWPNVSLYLGLGGLYGATLLWLGHEAVSNELFLYVVSAPVLIWLSIYDLRHLQIPDLATLTLATIAVCFWAFTAPVQLPVHLLIGAAVTVFFWALGEVYFRRRGHEGLGIGDAKLFGAGALLLGPQYLPELILFSSLGGIAAWLVSGQSRRKEGLPFAPFIAYAIFILSLIDPVFLNV